MRLACWTLTLGLLLLPPAPLRAEIVDGMVGVAGDRVITWSGALLEANYDAFLNGRPPRQAGDMEAHELRSIVERLIDRRLLEQARDLSPYVPPANGQADTQLRELRERYPTEAALQQALARYGLTESLLRQRLSNVSSLLGFVDYRLRPQVSLDDGAVERYYREVLLPDLREARQAAPALSEVRGRIEQILTEQEINRLLEAWLRQLRAGAEIKVMLPSAP